MTQTEETINQSEQFLFEAAATAYFKACESSNPQHWMEAAMLAQQHRNELTKLHAALAAQSASQPVVSGWGREISFGYTNWRGETSHRRAQPISLRYGTSEYH